MALPMWITNIENKCPPLKTVINCFRRAKKIKRYLVFIHKQNQRRMGNGEDKYKKILALKRKYDGKRCFIIATGPSLTLDDLELLKNEYTFAMNSICRIYDKTDFRPTFYGIQDGKVFGKMLDCVYDQDEKTTMLIADSLDSEYQLPEYCVQFPYNVGYHYCSFRRLDNYSARFSDNAYDVVYDGYSITYSLIQIAVYLGFKEIYLLGVDCNYGNEKKHFVESGYVDKNAYLNHDKMIVGYQKAKEYADSHGIKIFNCTRGGMLEVYPRMSLEDVLKEKKQ